MSQKIEFKVGLFILITTLLIMASIGYVFYKKGIFAPVHTYTLSSNTGESLTEGMPVVFGGIIIGRVSSMELDEQGTVLIRIKIPQRHNRVIRADSKFVIEKPLLGSSRIVVTTGNLQGPPLSPTTVSEITVSSDINEIIRQARPIVDKADRIMGSMAHITENLADPNGDVRRILRNAETVTSRFSKRESILEMAVGNPESIRAIHETLGKLRDIAVRADSILTKVDTLTGKTGEEINGVVRDLLVLEDQSENDQVDAQQDERVEERPENAEQRSLVLRLEVPAEEVREELAVAEEIGVDRHRRALV